MEIITQEHLASNFIKIILAELWQEFVNDKEAHEAAQTFDDWMYERLADLGEAVYRAIGEHYGDLDSAIEEVM